MTRVLLVSTYELGAQPLGLAGPAAELEAAGHEVRTADLSVEEWPSADIAWAEAIGFSVPMHTACRLALAALACLRLTRPETRVAFYGLYAHVAEAAGALAPGDCAVAGETGAQLASWLAEDTAAPTTPRTTIDIGSPKAKGGALPLPRRKGIPDLSAYAHLVIPGGNRLVGTVEASRGCNHRCRHCPVPVVYDGRSRPVAEEAVLADIDALFANGATHIRFSDPDFLNRPAHAVAVARALHTRHPDVSFDATIKVSHLLRHRDAVAQLCASGLSFVVSAFESTSATVLERLDKHHTAQDCGTAVAILRKLGVEIRPSLLPFTPWTTREDLVEILDFVARYDLVPNVDPVQYSIRLLIPPGSLVLGLDDPVVHEAVAGYDPDALGYTWTPSDPLLDEIQAEIARIVEVDAAESAPSDATYQTVRAAVFEALGVADPGTPEPIAPLGPPAEERPRLSEPWFCCAEPTDRQISEVVVAAN